MILLLSGGVAAANCGRDAPEVDMIFGSAPLPVRFADSGTEESLSPERAREVLGCVRSSEDGWLTVWHAQARTWVQIPEDRVELREPTRLTLPGGDKINPPAGLPGID